MNTDKKSKSIEIKFTTDKLESIKPPVNEVVHI